MGAQGFIAKQANHAHYVYYLKSYIQGHEDEPVNISVLSLWKPRNQVSVIECYSLPRDRYLVRDPAISLLLYCTESCRVSIL